jgi:choline/glycine/proline betaine transport protein
MMENGGTIVGAVEQNMPTAIFVFLDMLPWPTLMSVVAVLLVITFFVTSSDSGSLVIDIIASGGNLNPPIWQRIFWAMSEGTVATVLLLAGSLGAIQTAAISSALPFAFIMLLMCYGLFKALRQETISKNIKGLPSQ